MNKMVRFFLWGLLSAGAALFIESLVAIIFSLRINPNDSDKVVALIALAVFVIIEEGLRYLILYAHKKHFHLKKFALGAGIFLGLGFAVSELGLSLFSSTSSLVTFSLFLPAFIHIWSGASLGLSFSIPQRSQITRLTLLAFVLLIHVTYNYLQLYQIVIQDQIWTWFLVILTLLTLFVWISLPRLVPKH